MSMRPVLQSQQHRRYRLVLWTWLRCGLSSARRVIKMGESKRIKILLPALHATQLKVVQEAKRYNVLCCGRRWGKTVLGMDRLIHPALQGKPVAWFSPTNKLMADTWRE